MKYIYLIIIVLLHLITTAKDNKKTKSKKIQDYFKEMSKVIDKDSPFKKMIQLNFDSSNLNVYFTSNEKGEALSYEIKKDDIAGTNKLAQGIFVNQHKDKGWSKLSLLTFSNKSLAFNSIYQAYFAGYLEGVLTSHQINSYYINKNEKNNFNEGVFKKVADFFNNVSLNLESTITQYSKENITKKQVNFKQNKLRLLLGYIQLVGLHDGYQKVRQKQQAQNEQVYNDISIKIFLIMQADGELPELRSAFSHKKGRKNLGDVGYLKENFGIDEKGKNPNQLWSEFLKGSRCSAFVKLLKDQNSNIRDIIIGHTAWGESIELLRIFKYHNFQLEGPKSNENSIFPSFEVLFSAYPATLSSTDDFYITSNKLAVTETTLEVVDVSLYKDIDYKKYYPNYMRVISSTRFSTSALEWTNSFKKTSAYTYSSQWLIVDYNKLAGGKNFFYVLEQTPGNFVDQDMSEALIKNGYFGSYNKAFFEKSRNNLNYNQIEKIYTKAFTTDSNRGQQFKLLEKTAIDINSAMAILRYNGYGQNIPGDPSNISLSTSISARYDNNGPTDVDFVGGIDSKITNLEYINNLQVLTQSGPTGHQNNDKLNNFTYKDTKVPNILGISASLSYPYLKLNKVNMLLNDNSDKYEYKYDIFEVLRRKNSNKLK